MRIPLVHGDRSRSIRLSHADKPIDASASNPVVNIPDEFDDAKGFCGNKYNSNNPKRYGNQSYGYNTSKGIKAQSHWHNYHTLINKVKNGSKINLSICELYIGGFILVSRLVDKRLRIQLSFVYLLCWPK